MLLNPFEDNVAFLTQRKGETNENHRLMSAAASVTVTKNKSELNQFEIKYEQNVVKKNLFIKFNPYWFLLLEYVGKN